MYLCSADTFHVRNIVYFMMLILISSTVIDYWVVHLSLFLVRSEAVLIFYTWLATDLQNRGSIPSPNLIVQELFCFDIIPFIVWLHIMLNESLEYATYKRTSHFLHPFMILFNAHQGKNMLRNTNHIKSPRILYKMVHPWLGYRCHRRLIL
jgi:hypothetical protein